MFQKYLITKDKFKYNFTNFANATNFENVTVGRKGAVICDMNNNIIPLVRTTTTYRRSGAYVRRRRNYPANPRPCDRNVTVESTG